MIHLRKYFEEHNFDESLWKTDLGFIIDKHLFVMNHLMITNASKSVLFPLNFYCTSSTCLDCKVEIVDVNGHLCKLISKYSTNAKEINRSRFSYDPNGTDNIPFLSQTGCRSAYIHTQGQVCTNIFANGIIDLIQPHLEQFLISLNWTTTDLYEYRNTTDDPYVGEDDPEGDANWF